MPYVVRPETVLQQLSIGLEPRSVCPASSLATNRRSEMFYPPQEVAVNVVNANRLDEDDTSKSTELFMGISNPSTPTIRRMVVYEIR